jgi:hypothetical protein
MLATDDCRNVLSTTVTASEARTAAAKVAQAERRWVRRSFQDEYGPGAAPSTGCGISSS